MISKYIDNKELKRAIEDGKLKPFRIRKILKDQGIILASTNSEQIAEQVYPILWGNCDIEKLSQSLDDGANYIKSSVMEMEIKDSDNIMDDLEDFFGNASFGMTRYGLSAVSRVNDDKLIVKLRYSIIRPGRNEFISTQYKNTDIIVTNVSKEMLIQKIEELCGEVITYKTNLVKCLPLTEEQKLRYPNRKEIDSCFEHLVGEIQAMSPKIVFLLGEKVYSSVGKHLKINFEKWDEFEYHYKKYEGTYYVPIHHPSYIYVYKRKRMDEYIEGVERIINQLL